MGGGSTTQSSSGPPSWLASGLQSTAPGLLSTDPATRDKSLSAYMMDPEAYKQIGTVLQSEAQGDYLDPAKNPALTNYMNVLHQQTQSGYQDEMAKLKSEFAQSGQYSMGANSPLLQAGTQLASKSAASEQSALAPQLLSAYGQERGIQNQALGALGSYEQTPINLYNQIASMFNQGTSVQTNQFGMASLLGK
jgi:hypothetical protein